MTVEQFKIKLEEQNKKIVHRVERYKRDDILRKFNHQCAYCGAEIDASKNNSWGVVNAIPLRMGGVDDMDNRIPSCISCIQCYSSRDCIEAIEEQKPNLVEQHIRRLTLIRNQVLLNSENHLTDKSNKSDLTVIKSVLQKRHEKIRTQVYVEFVEGGLCIGWIDRTRTAKRLNEISSLCRYVFNGEYFNVDEKINGYLIAEARALELIWLLIEENTLVINLGTEVTDLQLEQDWQWCWFWRSTSLMANKKRTTQARKVLPFKRRDGFSQTKNAIRNRNFHTKQRAIATEKSVKENDKDVINYLLDSRGIDAKRQIERTIKILEKQKSPH